MRSTAVLVLAMLVLSSPAACLVPGAEGSRSTVYYVDDDGGHQYTTIQAAIDAAYHDDAILVMPGVYRENLVVDKDLTIQGTSRPECIIDGGGNGTVVTIDGASARLEGFTVRNGGPTHAGIRIKNADFIKIFECNVSDNRIGVRDDQGTEETWIADCVFTDNSKAGVWIIGDGAIVDNCTYSRNGIGASVTGRNDQVINSTFNVNDIGVSLGSFPQKVLLMGNSYTHANNLDVLTRGFLRNVNIQAGASRLTSGGLTLADHANRALASGSTWNTTLNAGSNWDTVVLQDQSQIPGFYTDTAYWQNSLAGAMVLDGMIEETGADTMLLMTWGRRNGDPQNPSIYPNFKAMQDRLEAGYNWYAENLSSPQRPVYIAPVGLAFEHIYDVIDRETGNPTAPSSLFSALYSSDGSHPSLSGSYLAACVLFSTMTGRSPVGTLDTVNLPRVQKLELQQAAEATVFNETPGYVYPWRSSQGANVEGNEFKWNEHAISLGLRSHEHSIVNNAVVDSWSYGLRVLDEASRDNSIHHNGFQDSAISNAMALDKGLNNSFDDGAEGNYWSDYEDRYPSASNDGTVWDTHYLIDHGAKDRYPLVRYPAFEDTTSPIADAGPDIQVPDGQVVDLDGTASTDDKGIVSWNWTFHYDGGTIFLNGVKTQFIFHIPGVYEVVLVVTDEAGNWDVDHVNITVLDGTDPEAIIILHATGEQFETATLDGSTSTDLGTIVNWTWTIDHEDQHAVLHGMTVEFTFEFAGDYSINLKVTDAAGNTGAETIYSNELDRESPVADAGMDQEVPQGAIVYFDASGSNDNVGIDRYAWTFFYQDEEVTLTGVTPDRFFGEVGVYTITLKVWDIWGLYGIDTVNITVLDVTDPLADAGDDMDVDLGDTVIFDVGASSDNIGIVAFGWELEFNGSTHTGSEDTFTWTFESPGLWTIRLTVEDAAGNSDTDMMGVTVIDVTPPTAFAPTYDVEMGDTVVFDGSLTKDNVGIIEWTWVIGLPGEDEVLTGETPSFKFDPHGHYTYSLTVRDAAGNSNVALGIVIVRDNVPPIAPRFKDITIKSHGTVVLDASGATDNVGVVRYLWWYDDGGKDYVELEGKRVEHQFPEAGDYDVHLTVFDEEGNTETTSFTVHVEDSLLVWVPVILGVLAAVVVVYMVIRHRRS